MLAEKGNEKNESTVLCVFISLCLMTLINVGIVVVLRVLLDAVDEINEPLIKGDSRYWLSVLLLLFVMTFFFGCWLCCCCGCYACRLIPKCPSATSNLITNISHKLISSHPSIRKRFSIDEDEIEIAEVVVTSNIERPPLAPRSTDRYAYENPFPIIDEMVETEASTRIIVPPGKTPLGRTRSYSIDVSYK